MPAQKQTIEFLPKEDWEKTTFGKILKWILTIGRYIVIFTELIVISAFLMRFKLDRDINDLHEKIKQKVAIISAASEFEKSFRSLQSKLKKIEETEATVLMSEGNSLIANLAAIVPINVSISQLRLNEKKISLTAIALSESGMASFMNNLKKNGGYKNLEFSKLSVKRDSGAGEITFEITGDIISQGKTEK